MKILDLFEKKKETYVSSPEKGFVPYACHYDEQTILTKDADLMQVIKITGFNFDNVNEDIRDLRSKVRNAVKTQIKDQNFLIYFHTLRSRKDLDPGGGKYDNPASKMIHDQWCKKNFWHDKYVNELYITIIIRGDNPFKLNGFDDFIKSFSFRGLQKKFNKKIDYLHEKIDGTVSKLITSLGKYGARRLSIKLDNKGAYSEILAFLGKLSYLLPFRGDIPILDLSNYLTNSNVTFGNNMIEVSHAGKKKFAAIFTIKEYQEISAELLDGFLQLPQNFIITQTFSFAKQKDYVKDYEYSEYILKLSDSHKLSEISGINNLLKKSEDANDFGIYQLSIMIYDDDIQSLHGNIERAAKELSALGLVFVREDLNLEEIFWSQLPSNSRFITRKSPLKTEKVAGFASLHNFPHGSLKSIWGNAITIFRTNIGTPYFFNFHNSDSGHSLIVGTNSSGRRSILNFIISEATKFNPKIYSVASRKSSEIFYKAMGGSSHKLFSQSSNVKSNLSKKLEFNPFSLDLDVEENRTFLVELILCMAIGDNNAIDLLSNELIEVAKSSVERISILPLSERNFDSIHAHFEENLLDVSYSKMRNNLLQWCKKYPLGSFFQENDVFDDLSECSLFDIHSFDLTMARSNLNAFGPLYLYVMHRLLQSLDAGTPERPSIIVFDSLMDFLHNNYLASKIEEILNEFKQKNIVAIFLLESITKHESIDKIKNLSKKHFATKIFTPQEKPPETYSDIFEFNYLEFNTLKQMSQISRNFMIQKSKEHIVAELNIAGLNKVISLISHGNNYHVKLRIAEEVIEEFGDIPENWLPKFFEKIEELNV